MLRRLQVIHLAFCIFLLSACQIPINKKQADGVALPGPPTGYSWVKYGDGSQFLLKPDNWFVKVETKNGIPSVYVTKEDIDKHGKFITGFSLHKIRHVPAQQVVVPSQYARLYSQTIKSEREEIFSDVIKGRNGDIYTVRYGNRVRGIDSIFQFYIVGDDSGSCVYLASFEAPEKEWDELYRIGKTVISKSNFGFDITGSR